MNARPDHRTSAEERAKPRVPGVAFLVATFVGSTAISLVAAALWAGSFVDAAWCIALGSILLWRLRHDGADAEFVLGPRPRGPDILVAIAAAIPLAAASYGTMVVSWSLVGEWYPGAVETWMKAPPIAAHELVVVCLLAPAVEELLFRRLLLARLSESLGPWAAILVSSAAFGAAHLQYFVGALITGIAFGVLYASTRSLVVTIICHVAQNTLITLLATTETLRVPLDIEGLHTMRGAALGVSLLSTAALFRLLLSRARKVSGQRVI